MTRIKILDTMAGALKVSHGLIANALDEPIKYFEKAISKLESKIAAETDEDKLSALSHWRDRAEDHLDTIRSAQSLIRESVSNINEDITSPQLVVEND